MNKASVSGYCIVDKTGKVVATDTTAFKATLMAAHKGITGDQISPVNPLNGQFDSKYGIGPCKYLISHFKMINHQTARFIGGVFECYKNEGEEDAIRCFVQDTFDHLISYKFDNDSLKVICLSGNFEYSRKDLERIGVLVKMPEVAVIGEAKMMRELDIEATLKAVPELLDFDQNEVQMGIKVEYKEHLDVTGGDPWKVGRIALAHLKEISDYYSRLKKMEGE